MTYRKKAAARARSRFERAINSEWLLTYYSRPFDRPDFD
jgi:hypothetical protein